jgi:ribosomal protein S27E
MTPFQFTCENCGQHVSYMDAGLYKYEHRNQCPTCGTSKHIMFGTAQLPPCDQLMRTVSITVTKPPFIHTQCNGCGYWWVTYDEDHWSTLSPAAQTEMINAAWKHTEQKNKAPTLIYIPRAQYQTPPPPIPEKELGPRNRVVRRP